MNAIFRWSRDRSGNGTDEGVAHSHFTGSVDDIGVARGHAFCRHADDCNLYVRTQRSGERVMASVSRFLRDRLKLRVNEAKSAVDRPWKRKFLGYSMTGHRMPRLKVAPAIVKRLKGMVRQEFRKGRGRSLQTVIDVRAPKLRGWGELLQACRGEKRVRGTG